MEGLLSIGHSPNTTKLFKECKAVRHVRLSSNDITNDEFEVYGEWWVPENPSQKARGFLKYSKGTGILEIQGVQDIRNEKFKLSNSGMILGDIPGMRGITLTKCHLSNELSGPRLTQSTYTFKLIFVTHLIFTNCNFEKFSDISFKKCIIHFQYLEQWIGQPVINAEPLSDKIAIQINDSEPIKATISSNLDILLISSWSTSNFLSFSDFTIKQSKYFSIESKESLKFEELKKIIYKLQNFLSFALGKPSHHTQIIGYLDEGDSDKNSVGIFHDSITSELVPDRVVLDDETILFSFGVISEHFEKILKNWFRISEDYKLMIEIISVIKYTPHMNLKHVFLDYFQALLLYHSMNLSYISEQMPRSEYKERIETICESIEDENIRCWVKSKIGSSHSNSKPPRRQISEIIANHAAFMNIQSVEGRDNFARQITHTRDNLIHQNKRNGDFNRFVEMQTKLKILVESIILNELDIDSRHIKSVVKREMDRQVFLTE